MKNPNRVVSSIIIVWLTISAFSLVTSKVQAQTACVPPPSGLVAWWPGDGNANDIQDNNPGTLQNGATFAPGKVGQAFSFDGVDDYVDVGAGYNLTLDGRSFTLMTWANLPSLIADDNRMFLTKGNNSATSQLFHFGKGYGPSWVFAFYGNGLLVPFDIQAGVWYHVVGTYDATTNERQLYVDGNLIGQNIASSGLTNTDSFPLLIGRRQSNVDGGGNMFWHGLIDEVAMFNRALLGSEVQSIFAAGSDGYCKYSLHDIKVTAVSTSAEAVDIGSNVTITVTVTNIGDFEETDLSVEALANSTSVGMSQVPRLAVGESISVFLTWQTAGFVPGTYLMKGVASLPAAFEDANPSDNSLVNGPVFLATHDISLSYVNALPDWAFPGERITISVPVTNSGNVAETFNVTAYYDNTAIERQTVTDLGVGATQNLSFTWETGGIALGRYAVKAVADPVPGERDVSNNAYTGNTVTFSYPFTLDVKICVDGSDYLYVRSDRLWIVHRNYEIPCSIEVKILDSSGNIVQSTDWNPTWYSDQSRSTPYDPNPPRCRINQVNVCNGYLTNEFTFTHVPVILDLSTYLRIGGRNIVRFVELPSESNNFTTVLLFDDDSIGGPADYEARVSFFSLFTLDVTLCVDGSDYLYLQNNRLWIVHRNWELPTTCAVVRVLDGRGNLVSSTNWTPDWYEDQSRTIPYDPNPARCGENGCVGYVSDEFEIFPSSAKFDLSTFQAVQGRNTVTLSQFPSPSNSFTTIVLLDDDPIGGPSEYEVSIMFFRVNTLNIVTTVGGTTAPAPGRYTYLPGVTVNATATADSSYRFDHWTLDGSNAGSISSISVRMDSDHALTAVFAVNPIVGGEIYPLETHPSSYAYGTGALILGATLGTILATHNNEGIRRPNRWRWVLRTVLLMGLVLSGSGLMIGSTPYQQTTSPLPNTENVGLRAAIVDGLGLTHPNQTFIESVTTTLQQAGFQVDYYPGRKTTVEFYRNLATMGYGLIILRVHSSATWFDGRPVPVVIYTSEPYDPAKYPNEQSTNQLGLATLSENVTLYGIRGVRRTAYFGVTPFFVTQSMKGAFRDATIVMMGCQGLKDSLMAKAFLEKGARTYIGWDGWVSAARTDGTTTKLLQHLFIQGQSLHDAVENATSETGPDPAYDSDLLHYPFESAG